MHKEVYKYLRLKRKLMVLEYARVFGSNLEAYKACGINLVITHCSINITSGFSNNCTQKSGRKLKTSNVSL